MIAEVANEFTFTIFFYLLVFSLMDLSKPTLPPQKPGETIKASLPRVDRKEMETPTLETMKT
jgi:hypothetical protein